MQNLLIASCLALAVSAEAFYGYSGPGLATWPSASYGYGSSSTVYGAHGYRIGKRSAEPFYGYGIGYGVALPTTLENRNNVHGHEAHSQYAISQPHPGFAGSYQQVSRLHSGLHYGGYYGYGKRSAEPFYGAATSAYAVNQAHPGYAGSYRHVSRLHTGLGYGYGGYLY